MGWHSTGLTAGEGGTRAEQSHSARERWADAIAKQTRLHQSWKKSLLLLFSLGIISRI